MPDAVPIALQLYTLRAAAVLDLRWVLERVASMGFIGVELAGLHGNPPATVREWLRELGLTAVAAHAKLPVGDAESRILDELSEVGVDTLVVPWAAPERFRTLDSVRSLADDLLKGQENAARRGISLGYHNHDFELATTIGGATALAHLFRATGPTVFAEVDVYWVKVGGADPAAVVAELGSRVRLLHIKDGPADGTESPMTAVGEGVIDFPSIVAAGGDVRWHVVELDACATDMFEAVEASYRWLVGQGLSRGRA